MASHFTFLNTSHAPSLGAVEAKKMRSHITRTNFARRRQRFAKERQKLHAAQSRHSGLQVLPEARLQHTSDALEESAWPDLDPTCDRPFSTMSDYPNSSVAYLLHEFRPIIFPAGTGTPGSDRETVWVNLLLSEPALIEASMSIGLKYFPKWRNAWGVHAGDIHKIRAIKMINSSLGTAAGLTDGILGAVFTLTYAERLANNDAAVEVHTQGLAQMIRLRRSSGNNPFPTWFSDFLLHDSIGQSISSQNDSHNKLMQALRNEDHPTSMDVSRISDGLDHLRRTINDYHASPNPPALVRLNIEYQVECLQLDVEVLLASEEHHVRTLRCAFRLFLLLMWPSKPNGTIQTLADELRYALTEPHIRLCSSMALTIWEFFVGALAAEAPGETRSWFIDRLGDIFKPRHATEWRHVVDILSKAFMPPECLLEKCRVVWQEVDRAQVGENDEAITID
ncbi:hypothetical protein FALBO_17149 [Fusarium albosuccineum]|uniref:Uncharacterized protein n=1 Tax=Fusarium albosuccineum TaxID=1237068 RepID=A0A8H4K6Q2_9HYPO|nr:hypothetical protein FALBO_17149 [Fusarium albosuccineum]